MYIIDHLIIFLSFQIYKHLNNFKVLNFNDERYILNIISHFRKILSVTSTTMELGDITSWAIPFFFFYTFSALLAC